MILCFFGSLQSCLTYKFCKFLLFLLPHYKRSYIYHEIKMFCCFLSCFCYNSRKVTMRIFIVSSKDKMLKDMSTRSQNKYVLFLLSFKMKALVLIFYNAENFRTEKGEWWVCRVTSTLKVLVSCTVYKSASL